VGVFRRRYRDEQGVLRTSRFFYCTDPRTGEPRSLRVTDERLALIAYAELLREHERRVVGVATYDETRRAKPLALLEAFLRAKADLNLDPRHLDNEEHRVRCFLERVGSVAELTTARVEELLPVIADAREEASRRRQPGRKRHRMSPRTRNAYLTSLRAFFSWLVETKRWGENPCDAVARAEVKGPANERWSLTREQLTALVDYPVPLWRAVAYLLAATTGLRRGELKQLLEPDLDLTRAQIRARARMTKNSDDETLPLPPWTVEMLRDYLRAVPPDFRPSTAGKPTPPRGRRLLLAVPTVKTLRRDLKRVGVDPVNEAGDVFDFHSLRVSCATILAVEGVGLQLVSRIMRHSDVRLTQAIYTRLVLHDTRSAVAAFRPARTEPARKTAGGSGGSPA
jgi:integrase/recombinase XerD